MNVLVVDDQREVVSGLLNGLHWKELEIDDVYSACCAEEARRVFLSEQIDILLCDIEMPGENGLSLFRWVVQKFPQTECIFLTSHAEFSYAKEAISLGSFDYILQPARYEEIEASIQRARRQILQKNSSHKLEKIAKDKEELADGLASSYLIDLLYYHNKTEENLNKIFSLKLKKQYHKMIFCTALQQIVHWKPESTEWEGSLLCRSISNILTEVFEPLCIEPVLLRYKRQHHVLLLCMNGVQCSDNLVALCQMGLQQYHQFEEQYMDFDSAVYLGDFIQKETFSEEFQNLSEMARQNIMAKNDIFVKGQQRHIPVWDKQQLFTMERWADQLEQGHGDRIIREIRNYYDRPNRSLGKDLVILKELHCGFTSALVSVMQRRNFQYSQIFNHQYPLHRYMEAHDTYEHFMQAVEYVITFLSDQNPLTFQEDQIDLAIRYIQENPEKKLTREEVAEYVHLNEDYFSRLFKEKTGYTVKDYIIKEKIKLAKELLATTNMSISIISLKTGFGNFSHFSRTFKKCEGITPNEYREQEQYL